MHRSLSSVQVSYVRLSQPKYLGNYCFGFPVGNKYIKVCNPFAVQYPNHQMGLLFR
jgi:hypothetical protein